MPLYRNAFYRIAIIKGLHKQFLINLKVSKSSDRRNLPCLLSCMLEHTVITANQPNPTNLINHKTDLNKTNNLIKINYLIQLVYPTENPTRLFFLSYAIK